MDFALQLDRERKRMLVENIVIEKQSTNDVLLHIEASAINRRDDWICRGAYPNIQDQVTLGSDGFGRVATGKHVGSFPDGVIICPSVHWGAQESYPGTKFHILGMPSHGTFANRIMVPIENIFASPKHLNRFEAAALPLAGLTAYRSVFTKGQVKRGAKVLISGVGGGVAVFALQFSLALGAEVYVTSGSEHKIERAISMGAKDGVLYTKPSWKKDLPKGFDVIIDSAGGDDFGAFISLIGSGGRIVFFGGTNGSWPSIKPQHLFFKQASILATTMGSPREFGAMCSFVETYKIVPVIDSIFSIDEHDQAFERLLHKDRFGKIVFDHSK